MNIEVQEHINSVTNIIKIYLIVKRLFDIIFSLIGLLFLIPLTIIIKISYLLTKDTYTIFYKQERIGLNGKVFTIYKFRTMTPNADKELDKILKKDKKLRKEYSINKKLKNDPRVTKVGKILRRFSLDELPQVINVLKGEMSIVGNRPYLLNEKEDMGESYNKIVSIKPGLTGYWQVNGRSNVSFDKRLELETYYSDNYNILLDIKILIKTIFIIFRKTSY